MRDTWKNTVSQTWQPALEEVVEAYFKAARASFQNGDALEGAEILTDAVRATLGHIAATRNWPHGTHDDLYSIAAALGSRTEWPNTIEELDQPWKPPRKRGQHMSASMGASMGLPKSLKFGTYAEYPADAEENGFSFATTAIELATSLAVQAAP